MNAQAISVSIAGAQVTIGTELDLSEDDVNTVRTGLADVSQASGIVGPALALAGVTAPELLLAIAVGLFAIRAQIDLADIVGGKRGVRVLLLLTGQSIVLPAV